VSKSLAALHRLGLVDFRLNKTKHVYHSQPGAVSLTPAGKIEVRCSTRSGGMLILSQPPEGG
jgi:hypothetical protein